MEKIVVKWTEGRSKGTTSVVKRSAVKSEAIAVGEKVSVVWGKSKKVYNAEVVDDGSSFEVPQQATRTAAEEDEPLAMELADPAPAQTRRSPHQDRQPALIQKMDNLADAVAGLEARVTCQFQQLLTQLANLQKDLDEVKRSRVSTVEESLPRRQSCHLHQQALVPGRHSTTHHLRLC